MMARPRPGRLAGLLVSSALLASCGGQTLQRASGLQFQTLGDEALAQPVTLSWDVDAALQARVDAGEIIFGVFVDRSPLPPGGSLRDLADDDCRNRVVTCPDAEWLADRRVFATRGAALQVSGLGDRRTSKRDNEPDRHRAVVVLLDSTGTRVDESYWDVTFLIDRTAP